MYIWLFLLTRYFLGECEFLTTNLNHDLYLDENTFNRSNHLNCFQTCDCKFVNNDLDIRNNFLETSCTNLNLPLEQILSNLPNQTNILNLSNFSLNKIQTESFTKFTNLIKLVLSSNSILKIENDAFNKLSHLETLKINNNLLKEAHLSFDKLHSLQHLYITNNQFGTIRGNFLKKNANIRTIEIIEFIQNSTDLFLKDVFSGLKKLRKLTLSSIKSLSIFPNLTGDESLEYLTIERCQLIVVNNDLCKWSSNLVSIVLKSNRLKNLFDIKNCKHLKLLDLSYNFITSLVNNDLLPQQSNLLYLFVKNNLIKKINEFDFKSFKFVQVLDLENNEIDYIHENAFLHFSNLQDLNLGQNKFKKLPTNGLQKLIDLKTYGNINLKEFPKADKFPKVQKLVLSYAYHCCQFLKNVNFMDTSIYNVNLNNEIPEQIVEKVIWSKSDLNINSFEFENLVHNALIKSSNNSIKPKHQFLDNNFLIRKYDVECIPQPSPFMPCEDLFDYWILRCGVWLVFLLAILGNFTVIIVFAFGRTKIDVPRFLVCNLAIADMLMGIYLCILAFIDSATLTMFQVYAVRWQNSILCSICGFLAVFSSELSVYTLAVITLERNYAITNAMHLNKRLSLKNAISIMSFGYIFVLILAILPITGISSYQKFAVCLPFETEDYWSRAYVLSLVIFNGLAFLILTGCYLKMYCVIRDSQAWNSNDTRIAKRMALLVFTDFLCWSPVATCTISSVFFGINLITLSQAKIFTIFVLPLNSCANPFLYAIFTKRFKKDCVILCKKLEESRITRGIGGCKHSSNFSNRHTPDCTNSIDKYDNDFKQDQTKIFYTNKNLFKVLDNQNLIYDNDYEDDEFDINFFENYRDNLFSSNKYFHLGKNDKFANLTSDYFKKNYKILLEQTSNGSKLICKCGIITYLPKSRLFATHSQFYLKHGQKLKKNKQNKLFKQDENKISQKLLLNDKEKPTVTNMNKQSIFKQMANKLFTLDKKENKFDFYSLADKNIIFQNCNLSNNDHLTIEELDEIDEQKRIKNLQLQFIKSKQRLDSISSENYSSRSDSWRQQNSTNLKLLEQFLINENIRYPNSLLKLINKNSCTTNSCSTSTFRISRSSVTSDNFKLPQFDKFNQLNKNSIFKEKDKLNTKNPKFDNSNNNLEKNIHLLGSSSIDENVKSFRQEDNLNYSLKPNDEEQNNSHFTKRKPIELSLFKQNKVEKNDLVDRYNDVPKNQTALENYFKLKYHFSSTNCLKSIFQNSKFINLKTRQTRSVEDFTKL